MRIFRKIMRILLGSVAVGILLFFCGGYPEFPLKGKLQSATITKHYINPAWNWRDLKNTNPSSLEETATITNDHELAQIERGMRIVWNSFTPVNSMEGEPRYRLAIRYANGSSNEFRFTRTEWSLSGFTPKALVETVETIISNEAVEAIGGPRPPQPQP